MTADLQQKLANLRERNGEGLGVATRIEGEDAAKQILDSSAGSMTREQALELGRQANKSYWDGKTTYARFGLAFRGGAWALAVKDMDRFNAFTARMWRGTEEEALRAFGDVMRDAQVMPGAGSTYPSLLLYLRYPSKYSVYSSSNGGGLSAVTGKKYSAKTIDEYLAFCADAQKVASQYSLAPQEIDLMLWAATRDDGASADATLADRLVALVRKSYPDWSGFDDSDFEDDERNYKVDASELAQSLLSSEALDQLVERGDAQEVVERVRKVVSATNLLWTVVPRDGDLNIFERQGFDPQQFAVALRDLLWGEDESPDRVDRFEEYTTAASLSAKWSLATYLLMLVHPDADFFVKPQATTWLLRQAGSDLKLDSRISGETYRGILALAEQLSVDSAAVRTQGHARHPEHLWVAFRAGAGGGQARHREARAAIRWDVRELGPGVVGLRLPESGTQSCRLHWARR